MKVFRTAFIPPINGVGFLSSLRVILKVDADELTQTHVLKSQQNPLSEQNLGTWNMEFAAKLACCISGVSLGIGLLVVLNSLKIPFYLYYPHVTQTVLTSATYDLYFFLASSVSVPSTLVLNKSKLARPGLIGILTMWAAALTLTVLGINLCGRDSLRGRCLRCHFECFKV